ncbi:helix-turn-helix domain-containing protein [Psychrobacter sp. PP-21]|jgi:transcriptional regulator with XRE-family HTH domain|uniref:helix-turn-helix domain-containing protein n=1 Tax=Psychrobacter sp. PP-21 TaxID=2957503 RepID=UPI0029AD1BF8|nr:helix-turn-helix transcriptional regulator [Psychrobacter sp. PP-21]MDX2375067.1 helix-turn-helix domain-containing protein [Psychrobacter sp. PP-21]|tara:strand:+ start:1127 stop:1405 length:279 start_codon:yes stop_codon:yes gene_type:complete
MKIGSVIRKCRKLKGMTQLQLSDSSNISESYLSLIEQDKRQPTLSNLESIAGTLQVPISILVFLADKQESISEITDKQIEALTETIYSLVEA